jgi:hypothetical protein
MAEPKKLSWGLDSLMLRANIKRVRILISDLMYGKEVYSIFEDPIQR